MSSKARAAVWKAWDEAIESYRANGRKPFDAGYAEGLKRAVEILDDLEDKGVDFESPLREERGR